MWYNGETPPAYDGTAFLTTTRWSLVMTETTVGRYTRRGKICTAPNCERAVYAKHLCGMHYQRLALLGRLDLMSPEERFQKKATKFWQRVDKSKGAAACWPWMGTRTKKYGYGKARDPRLKFMTVAHRMAWEYENGPIPDGLFVLHHCDNPPCCNPRHHFLGNDLDNQTDKEKKGRGNHVQGERIGSAKLTESDIRSIRRLRSEGLSQRAIGEKFGVAQAHISKILLGVWWRHVK